VCQVNYFSSYAGLRGAHEQVACRSESLPGRLVGHGGGIRVVTGLGARTGEHFPSAPSLGQTFGCPEDSSVNAGRQGRTYFLKPCFETVKGTSPVSLHIQAS